MVEDWGEIQEFLIGEVGKSERESYKVTFVEYNAYKKAYARRIEQGWEYTRYIAWRTELVSGIKPSAKHKSPEELMPLPCDKKRKKKIFEPINQHLSEDLESELYRVIGLIKKD